MMNIGNIQRVCGAGACRLSIFITLLALISCATPQQRLMKATASGNEVAIREALQKGGDINAATVATTPDAPCSDAAMPLQLATCLDHAATVQLLLSNKADPNLAGTGETPLVQSARKGSREVVRLLLDAGAKPNQPAAGHTALMSSNDAEIVKMLLLQAKADRHAQDDLGNTALMYAAQNSRADVARVLIQQDVDVRVKNKAGLMAMDFVRQDATKAVVREEYERVVRIDMDAALAKADQAAVAGDMTTALANYNAVLVAASALGKGPENEIRIRFMKSAAEWPTPPTLPEAAREHVIRADALLKRGRGAAEVEAELQQAITLAPWWAEGYFNLALVQGSAEHYKLAIDTLKLFVAGAPNSPRVQAAKDKMVDFTIGQEEADKVLGLAGWWASSNGGYTVSVAGDQLTFINGNGQATIKASLKDNALVGSLESKPYLGENRCMIPGQLHPVTGSISSDGKRITLEHLWSTYSTRAHCVDMFGNATFCCLLCSKVCDGVTIDSTTTQNETLSR